MSTVLFLLQLAGFVMVAHWAYTNDRIRPSDGSKGLLRMVGVVTDAVQPRKGGGPRWKRSHVDGRPAATRPLSAPRKASQPTPRWQRSL